MSRNSLFVLIFYRRKFSDLLLLLSELFSWLGQSLRSETVRYFGQCPVYYFPSELRNAIATTFG
jgi:hypothetical protein